MADQEVLVLRGTLEGHNGWVTSLATSEANPDLLLSGSRDKTLITWKLTGDDHQYGVPKKSFKGHSHIVQDVTISADGAYALSASWDRTLRLWDLESGECTQRFVGHNGDVLSCSIAKNLRQIVSASRDKTVKVWNTIGECMQTLTGHSDWVSAVRFSPSEKTSTVVSASWDKVVKAWDLNEYSVTADFIGHTGYISCITISPDGSLVASAGKDGVIILWDLNSYKTLYTLNATAEVHALAFSPNRYWLAAATASGIKIFNLQERTLLDELKPEFAVGAKSKDPEAVSLAWSADGQNLFAGYTDNLIRVWQVMTSSA
ncbi:Piso0_004901 [Millerozyma farinosa CBS 7064]|uniref:Small ribosomal subunit protein RACK1 n=1 Tax=Pichia sorbitophila (strain ATCC MYA-4447 / BCRC 22081 / CBS 7064 / NBRC 10061 / NRRL Y-12695) TaxID=559304 RepID=G8Y0R0_PICSO|nr:Piso0_004901 [Millerozyma farinosa CBS 7064]